jgi:rhodanese-related sulfurtransferase
MIEAMGLGRSSEWVTSEAAHALNRKRNSGARAAAVPFRHCPLQARQARSCHATPVIVGPWSGQKGRIRMVTRSIFAIALIALVATAALSEESGSAEAPSISPAELHAQRESGAAPVVIDVRTPEEYASGHIPDAVNIPFDQVAKRINEVDAPHGVALYCMIGPRARKGEAALLATGYENVFHLEGGLAAWQAAGLAVTDEK